MTAENQYAFDFHVHTSYSFDSLTPPRLAIDMARRRGLQGIAITDHDTVRGGLAALEANPYPDFFVIPGTEVKSDLGDIIGLFVTREIQSRQFGDVVDEIHAQGGIAYVPHPVRTFGEEISSIHDTYRAIDLWELYNGRYDRGEFAKAREAFSQLAIASPLCGSDAHFPWEIGLFRTVLAGVPRDPATLITLASGAELRASPRGDLGLRTGITLGAMIKAFKRKHYGKLGRIALSLPWKAAKRTVRTVVQRIRQ